MNGELRQDDSTAGLLFPLPQLVADLSQHFTLEPGDVILTGTPAGSSVVVPGDVVEVEVGAPDAPGAPSTGLLETTVTQGAASFDPALGSLPAVDDTQRAEAWGTAELPNRRSASRTTADSCSSTPVLTELREKLLRAPVAGLSAQLRKRGLNNVTIDGVRPMHPDAKLVGTAKTLRFVPNREDLFDSHGGGYNAQKRAFDAVGEGEVIVIEARGETGSGTLGDILALRAHARSAAGIVTDGGVRDCDAVAAVGIPVYSAGAHPAVLGRRHVPWDVDVTIGCGGTTVQPGDVIVGDADGVIVIPPALAEEVADATLAQEDEDAWIAEQVAAGHPVDGLFPMNAEWRARYQAMAPDEVTTLDSIPSIAAPTQSKSQRAYHWIKERIVRQEYTPGYRLVLGTIAGDLDMSVVPVREAIRQLEAEGLVTFERNVGAHVSMVDDSAYRFSMQALGILEGTATALAARRLTADDIRRARAVNELMIETLDHFDPKSFTALNHEFHVDPVLEVREPAHARTRQRRVGRASGTSATRPSASCPGARRSPCAEHENILVLIEQGAPLGEIEKAARRHRSATLDAYLIHEHPDEALGLAAF